MRTLPLADELFLVGHDEYTGKAIVNNTILDSGLAGAVLGELLLAGRVTMVDNRIVMRDPRPYGENVTDAAMAEILKRREDYPVRAWVEYLRDDVREMIARRLISAGMIERAEARGLSLRVSVRYPATDAIEAAAPRVRLRFMLDKNEPLDQQTAALAALVRAIGLEQALLLDAGRQQIREHIERATEPMHPFLHALAAGVDAAVAASALTIRR
jgi:Golgi phosphoprotein 3 (GPP34)